MTEDYISFETAKLLKEKGFEVPSFKPEEWLFCMYDEQGKLHWSAYSDDHWGAYSDDWYCRVTLQMAMRWLLETHHLLITTFSSSQESWMYRITKPHQRLEDGVYGEDYETREAACEAAIKYCLENLVL